VENSIPFYREKVNKASNKAAPRRIELYTPVVVRSLFYKFATKIDLPEPSDFSSYNKPSSRQIN
jgi:hypothetical protein